MKINPYKLLDFSEGILQGIANTIVPRNSVYLGINLSFDKKIGYAVVRDGTTKLGNKLSSNCNGIYEFKKTDGSSKLLSAFGTSIYSLETATWTTRTTVTNSKIRFVTFIDTVLALDGTNRNSSENGSSWVALGGNLDLDNMPLGKYGITWKDKLYIAGVSGNLDRLHFSSLYSVPDDGKISWTDETAGYMDVDPEDGAGGIAGLEKVPGYLLIFKERSIHRWDGNTLLPESLINIGTQSQESITRARETVFFWNERGVYETNGGYPRKVSNRIKDIIDAVDPTYNVSAWSDTDKVYFSIGDINLTDIDIKNCVICFNIDSQNWELYSFPEDMIALGSYIPSKQQMLGGSDDGQVWKLFDGSDDDSNVIEYHLQFQNIEVGERSRIKDISEVIVFTRGIRGGYLYARTESSDFKPLGPINSDVQVIKNDASGRYFDLRISGTSKSGTEIKGLEITELNISTTVEK